MPDLATIALTTAALLGGGAGVGFWLQRGRGGRGPAVPPAPAQQSREERRASIEAMVLRAGLEDTLCHLVEIYGIDYLDQFLERRVRRNVEPFRSQIDQARSSPQALDLWMEHAQDAENILKATIDAVRRDPSPPA